MLLRLLFFPARVGIPSPSSVKGKKNERRRREPRKREDRKKERKTEREREWKKERGSERHACRGRERAKIGDGGFSSSFSFTSSFFRSLLALVFVCSRRMVSYFFWVGLLYFIGSVVLITGKEEQQEERGKTKQTRTNSERLSLPLSPMPRERKNTKEGREEVEVFLVSRV